MKTPRCPACSDTRSECLGRLGNLDWFRCKACGLDHQKERRPRKPSDTGSTKPRRHDTP